MMGNSSRPRIPLPKQWPTRVRSGVLHAISLAHFSLTFTRSWAANGVNARIRLKAENDRLRQELALLQEEMRIKDARMLRIPAQRRPHYPPTERLAILELRAARAWSMAQAARRLLVTTATVASWIGRLDEEGPRALVQTRRTRQQVPRLRCLHRAAAQGALSDDGQGQDRPDPLPGRSPPRIDHSSTDTDRPIAARARTRVEPTRSCRDSESLQSCLAL